MRRQTKGRKGRPQTLFYMTLPVTVQQSCKLRCGKIKLQQQIYSGPYFPGFGLNTEILHISPYSVQMRETVDQNNSEYGHFSGSVTLQKKILLRIHIRIILDNLILVNDRIIKKIEFENKLILSYYIAPLHP